MIAKGAQITVSFSGHLNLNDRLSDAMYARAAVTVAILDQKCFGEITAATN